MKLKLFTHENCPACHKMKPIYKKVAEKYPMEIIDPTTEEGQEIAYSMDVFSSPTLVVMDDVNTTVGIILGAKREDEVWYIIKECEEEV